MIVVLIVALFAVVAFSLLIVFAVWFGVICVAALLLMLLARALTGRWPSAKAVTITAGLAFTGALWLLSGENVYVGVGGLIGTWIAARGLGTPTIVGSPRSSRRRSVEAHRAVERDDI